MDEMGSKNQAWTLRLHGYHCSRLSLLQLRGGPSPSLRELLALTLRFRSILFQKP